MARTGERKALTWEHRRCSAGASCSTSPSLSVRSTSPVRSFMRPTCLKYHLSPRRNMQPNREITSSTKVKHAVTKGKRRQHPSPRSRMPMHGAHGILHESQAHHGPRNKRLAISPARKHRSEEHSKAKKSSILPESEAYFKAEHTITIPPRGNIVAINISRNNDYAMPRNEA